MTWRARWTTLLVVLAAAVLWAADLPWVGQWRINVAKSDFGQSTITYAVTGPGEMQWTADGQTMKFKMDGKDYPDPWGGSSAWKELDKSSWETVNKAKGQVVSTDVTRLSEDGKSLTITSKGTRPNGKTFEDSYVMTRVSGGPGLPGKWRTAKVNIGAPVLVEFTPFETDGLTLKIADTGTTWSAKFDGKAAAVKGPLVTDGFTMALTRTGPRSFHYVQKQNGKELNTGTLSVSADGKTITVASIATGTTEKTTAVYDRQ